MVSPALVLAAHMIVDGRLGPCAGPTAARLPTLHPHRDADLFAPHGKDSIRTYDIDLIWVPVELPVNTKGTNRLRPPSPSLFILEPLVFSLTRKEEP
jgi:hypothetical protein